MTTQGATSAYQHYVDAQTGEIWLRKNIVEQAAPPPDTFSGSVPAVDGVCAPDNGPWVVAAGDVGAIVVSVEAHVPANDVVVNLKRNGAIVASQDTATSPEVLLYNPAGGVPAGSYTVQVCDFADGAAWTPPPTNTYSGQIVFSPVEQPSGFPYPPKWKVFPANPLIGNQSFPWTNPSTDTREVWCWESLDPDCQREVQNLASRVPWDYHASVEHADLHHGREQRERR